MPGTLGKPSTPGRRARIFAIVSTFTSAAHCESTVPFISSGWAGSSKSLRSMARFVTKTNSPERTALASVAFPTLKGRSDLAFQTRYLSPRTTIKGDTTRSVYVCDLTFTSGTLWPLVDLTVGVRNLFDQEYGDPGGNEHVEDQIPQDGRAYFLIFRHRF